MSQRKARSIARCVPILLLVVTVSLTMSCGQAEKIVDEARSRLGDTPSPAPTVAKDLTLPGTPVAAPAFTPKPADTTPGDQPSEAHDDEPADGECSLELTCAALPNVTTFIVNTTDDEVDATLGDGQCLTASGSCSLRAAIQEANELSPDPVYIPLARGTYGLTIAAAPVTTCDPNTPICIVGGTENSAAMGDLDITGHVCIRGRDRDDTIISVEESNVGRVLDVASGAHVCLLNLTVTNGYAPPWTATLPTATDPVNDEMVLPFCAINPDDCDGGGIRNGGNLHLNYVVVDSNASNNNGNGISNFSLNLLITNSIISNNQDFLGHGGGIFSASGSSVVVERSTISGNRTDLGAGISNFTGEFTLTNVTISGNEAAHHGAGVSNSGGGTVNINASTIFENQINNADGAGVFSDGGTINVKNSIVANTTGSGPSLNCLIAQSGIINPLDSNLEDGSDCGFVLNSMAPGLGAFGVYPPPPPILSGVPDPPPTYGLNLGSPAINAAASCEDHAGNTITMDQRTVSRPVNAACDIGAFELN